MKRRRASAGRRGDQNRPLRPTPPLWRATQGVSHVPWVAVFGASGLLVKYQTRPPTSATAPRLPTTIPVFARPTPLFASSNAGSFGGAAHSFVPTEQFDGTLPRPTPTRTPPATSAAPPTPATTSGSVGRDGSGGG